MTTHETTDLHLTSYLKIAGLGALIGLAVGTTMELLLSATNGGAYVLGTSSFLAQFQTEAAAVLTARVVYLIVGAVMAVSMIVFDVERLSLAVAQFLHFLVTIGTILGAGLILHWVRLGTNMLPFLAVAAVIYLIIWACIAASMRIQVRRTNEALAAGR